MKPFNLALAKAGDPVCTRAGREVRILCFDRKGGEYPIMGLIDYGSYEACYQWTTDGSSQYGGTNSSFDLMMAPKTLVGYANLYLNGGVASVGKVYLTLDEAKKNATSKHYHQTVQIEWTE